MSKEVIERIKTAEKKASASVRAAEEEARRIVEEAKAAADASVREAREAGEDNYAKSRNEGEAARETAVVEARREGAYAAAQMKALARVHFDEAVDFVIGRLA